MRNPHIRILDKDGRELIVGDILSLFHREAWLGRGPVVRENTALTVELVEYGNLVDKPRVIARETYDSTADFPKYGDD